MTRRKRSQGRQLTLRRRDTSELPHMKRKKAAQQAQARNVSSVVCLRFVAGQAVLLATVRASPDAMQIMATVSQRMIPARKMNAISFCFSCCSSVAVHAEENLPDKGGPSFKT